MEEKPEPKEVAGSGETGGKSEGAGSSVAPRRWKPKPSRRKRPSKKPPKPASSPSRSSQSADSAGQERKVGSSVGRGRGERRTLRFANRGPASGALGLGQIAPGKKRPGPCVGAPAPVKGIRAMSVGESGTSRVSSAYSVRFASQETSEMTSRTAPSAGTANTSNAAWLYKSGAAIDVKVKEELDLAPKYEEHTAVDADSDDDLDELDTIHRNVDLSSYAGCLTSEGILLPVSLAVGSPDESKTIAEEKHGRDARKPLALPIRSTYDRQGSACEKDEPMPVTDSAPGEPSEGLELEDFPSDSVASHLLTSQESIAFVQLPGSLPMMDSRKGQGIAKVEAKPIGEESSLPKIDDALESLKIGDRNAYLNTDIRELGDPGDLTRVGKVQLYRSGRVKFMLENGATLEAYPGTNCQFAQQLILIDPENGTCNELEDNMRTRIVCIPDLNTMFAARREDR